MKPRAILLVGLALLLAAGSALAGDYVIGDGDGLRVSVWGVPELSVDVKVRPDGKITLPAVGDLTASGLTPEQLGNNIQKALVRFVKQPLVTLTVTEITRNRVYIAGGGTPARVINLPGRTTLFKLLCQLGDLQNADLRRSYLLRNGRKVVTDFHALFLDGDFSRDVVLEPEDIVFIPNNELDKVYVVGAVKEPKYIIYRDGLKVLDAILEAGGFTEYADQNDVVINRREPELKIRVKLKDLTTGKDLGMNLKLQPGDYVSVAEKLF